MVWAPLSRCSWFVAEWPVRLLVKAAPQAAPLARARRRALALRARPPRPRLLADAGIAGYRQVEPGSLAQAHDFPAQARHPSLTAQPEIASATTPSSHQAPNRVLAARPTKTAIARYAHSRFWAPSPAVADEPSRAPIRRLAIPSAGSKMAVPAVSTRPTMLVSAWSLPASARIASTAM